MSQIKLRDLFISPQK